MKLPKMWLLSALGLVLLFSDASAEQKRGTQNRPSGPEIYRIELRNLGLFLVLANGEEESGGELHSISVGLLEPDNTRDRQIHTVVEKAPLLVNTSRNVRAGSGYLSVSTGDYVRLGERRGAADDYNLWIHSAYRNEPTGTYMKFNVSVTAKELDCSGQRVCRRGNIGTLFYEIWIPPLRAVPPRDCRAENTFRWTTVDGVVVLQGNDNLTRRIEMIKSSADGRDFVGFDANSIGPFLQLRNAEICIARTW